MNMFVEDTDIVEVKVHYISVGKKVEILEAPKEGSTTLTAVFRQPDFSTSQRLVSTSTSVSPDGSPAVNIMALQNNMIYFLAKTWDAKDAEGKPIILNNENIGRLRVEVARALINKLSQDVGQLM